MRYQHGPMLCWQLQCITELADLCTMMSCFVLCCASVATVAHVPNVNPGAAHPVLSMQFSALFMFGPLHPLACAILHKLVPPLLLMWWKLMGRPADMSTCAWYNLQAEGSDVNESHHLSAGTWPIMAVAVSWWKQSNLDSTDAGSM